LAAEPASAAASVPAASKPAHISLVTIAVAPGGETKIPATQPSLADKPEVLFMGPMNPNFELYDLVYSYLVESGVYMQLEDDDRLPEELPWDLSQYKVIVADAHAPFMSAATAKEHLQKFVDRGGMVITIKQPEKVNWDTNDPELYEVYDAVLGRGVRLQHPAFLKRNAARPDRQVILASTAKQMAVPGSISWYLIGNDVAYMHFEGLLKTAALYNRPEIRQFVLDLLQEIDTKHQGHAAVFGPHLVKQFKALGCESYYERVLASVDANTVQRLRDRVKQTQERGGSFSCERMEGFGYSCTLANLANHPELYDPAVEMIKLGHGVLFDEKTKLWAHGGATGQERTPPWSRGQGWALIGLIEALENLPKDHPGYPIIVKYLEETAEGLAQAQDATGLWHCVVDDPDTRLEASGTAMILRAYCHAWRAGVCQMPQVKEMLTKAWYGLKAHSVGGRTFSFLWGFSATHDKSAYGKKPSSGTVYLTPLAGPEYVMTFGPLVP
jgi:hypothetical protein